MEKFLGHLERHKGRLGEQNVFFTGRDVDRRADTNVVVFDRDEKYLYDPQSTHGITSHAILHLREFEPEMVKKATDQARSIIQEQPKVYILNMNNKIIAEGEDAKKNRMLTQGVILNTFDLINDDIMCGRPLNTSKALLKPLVDKLTNFYSQLIKDYKTLAINADTNFDEAKEAWGRGQIIKFAGTFRSQQNSVFKRIYYLNPKNNGILGTDLNGVPATFFKLAPGKNLIDYFSGNIFIHSKDVRSLLGIKS